MAFLINAERGSVTAVFPENRADGFSISEVHSLIGCQYIEVVPLDYGNVLVIDEEGKLKTHLVNEYATFIFWKAGGHRSDYIAGNALLCGPGEIQ